MIRIFPIFPFLMLLAVTSFGQIRDTSWTKEVILHEDSFIKPSKRIALFESDSFIIYSNFDLVVDNIKKFIDEYEVEEDKLLLGKFLNTSKSLENNLNEIKNDKALKERLDFRTADLIQKKNCLIYNKKSNVFETKIFVTNYLKGWRIGIRFTSQVNQEIMDLTTGAI